MTSHQTKRVAVVGSGFAGLSAAATYQRKDLSQTYTKRMERLAEGPGN